MRPLNPFERYLYEEVLGMFTAIEDDGPGKRYGDGVFEWDGYIYRLCNWYTGELSREIMKIYPATKMPVNWFYGHTIDPDLFIKDVRV